MVRILRIITRLNVGGPTRHVALLMAGLDAEAFEQRLVCGPTPSSEGPDLLPVPGRRILIPSLRREIRPWSDIQAGGSLRRVMAAFQPHIVHTHQGKAGALGRAAAAAHGVPVILHTYHGHTFRHYFGPLVGAGVLWAERRAARRSHALICQSSSQERDVLSALGASAEGRTRVIPPAIPLEEFQGAQVHREATRDALGIPANRTMLLLPARLVSVKAPARALELLFHLRAHVDACLIVAGEGPLRSALERRATSMKVARHVQFIGQRGDMASLYGAADVVVLTSVNEGTPLCLLEAMAAGTPVAATRVGGVADILGDDGLLFEPAAEPAAWARALVDHLDRKDDLRATVERARERVRSHHHPASMVASVRLLYEELLRRRS